MSGNNVFYKIEKSAVVTVIGIILLFSGAVIITLWAPPHVDPSWTEPTSFYQVQMYEKADPNFYISSTGGRSNELEFVYHLKSGSSLLAFQESELQKIVSSPDLEKYITKYGEPELKLTSRLLLLRTPKEGAQVGGFDAVSLSKRLQENLSERWEKDNRDWREEGKTRPRFEILELYDPQKEEAFAIAPTDGILENWVEEDFRILDGKSIEGYQEDEGVIYVSNPREYRITRFKFGEEERWRVDLNGEPISDVEELRQKPFGFRSRQELIRDGEQIYAWEGCWYCHTDQTRTLVQDVVVNGSDSYPAPPSSANEYIYQRISFPGTKRNGPDLSRVGVKRPHRDWHISHFWSPGIESRGSIMPSFQHFFDFDPRGTPVRTAGIPNYKFEAVYQYLMTKGTRITPPTEAWWLGKDPIQTKAIIEGMKTVKP